MSPTQGRKIALVGATGTIGTHTVSALLKSGTHTITAITRAESNTQMPDGVLVKKGNYADESFLASALEGQDILIIQVAFFGLEQQIPLIRAAAKAGVKHVLPTEFGSDPFCKMATMLPMLGGKKKYRDEIEAAGLSWIAVVSNPWFDWSLAQGTWGIDVAARKATLYSGAEAKFNTTTLAQVGAGVTALVSLPEEQLAQFKNKPVYLSSFEVSQRDILDSAIRATGTKESDWDIEVKNADDAIQEGRDAMAAGNPMAFLTEFYISHMREGLGGNYQSKAAQDTSILGMKEEVLDDVFGAIVKENVAKK